MQSHFSARLQRNYKNEDMLTRLEAAQVLAENSDRPVNPDYLKVLARRGELHPQVVSAHIFLYQYVELRSLVLRPVRGRRMYDEPTDNALRQRRFKERQRLQRV